LALLVSLAGFAFAFNAFVGDPPTPRVALVENGRIAIAVGRDQDVMLIEPGADGLILLVDRHGAHETNRLAMAWSPDASMLAFTDYVRDGAFQGLFVLEVATGDVLELSEGLVHADDPAWSPDGSRIAFGGADSERGYEIFVVGADGTGRTAITDEADDGVSGAHMPAWSPDGTRIAFVVDRYDETTETESHGVVVADASGGNESRLTHGLDEQPAWSAAGSTLVFLRRVGEVIELRAVSADGSAERKISRDGVSVTSSSTSAWAPDGRRLLYSYRDLESSNVGLAVADAETDETTTLLEDAFVGLPVWSPDGSRLAFLRDDAGRPLPAVSLWVTQPDRIDEIELADGLEHVSDIAWQPIVGRTESPAPTESPPPRSPLLNPRVTATIPVGASPRGVAVGEGAVWATVSATGDPDSHLLVRIDASTNEVIDTIPLPWVGDVAFGAGAVWVSSSDEVLRIDPVTGDVVAAAGTGAQPLSGITYGFDSIWVAASSARDGPSDQVLRIDPISNEVVARIPVEGGEARDVVVGEGSVWVYGHSRLSGDTWEASSLWRIDPATNEVVATVLDQNGFLGAGSFLPDNVAAGQGWIWAADDRRDGVKIDPSTGALTTFRVPGGFDWPYAVYAGHVFFGLGTVRVLDTETFEVVASVPLESPVADVSLDPAAGTLWIANYEGTVTRIDLH
jgi:dipeptidyl aminopeptidase/acylaminoacyl peptidase